MSVEANKALVRRFIELGWGRSDEAVFDECMDPDCHRHRAGAVTSGQSDAKQAMKLVRAGIPDLEVTIEQLIGDGDVVAVRSISRGTHLGEYIGVAPTGRRVEIAAVDFYRIANDRIVESWHNVDELGLLRQLGVLPAVSNR